MIKFFSLIKRRPDMTPEAFHDYYRHPHATLGLMMPSVLKYVQSHQVHSDLLGPDQARYEAIAEIWLEGEEQFLAFQQDPIFKRYVYPDGFNFTDMEKSDFIVATEEVVDFSAEGLDEADSRWTPDDRPLSVKLIQLVRGDHDWTSPQDGEIGAALGALRHVRCHPVASLLREGQEFLGVRELWWPTLTAFRAGVTAAPEAWQELFSITGPSLTVLNQAERFK